MARKQWRCFHCDEVFTRPADAHLHFGSDDGARPACQIKSHEGHLVRYIRQLEDRLITYMNDAHPQLQAIMTLEGDFARAVRDAEEKGYERGVRDMKALGYRTEAA